MKIKRYATKAARIEMLPLIDIVFLLLVLFIYAMLSMSVHHGLQLNLPKSSQAVKTEDTPISLSIRSNNLEMEIALNEQIVPLTELPHTLTQLKESTTNLPQLLVFADKDISYQQLYLVLDQIKLSGIQKVSLQATLN